MAPYKGVVDTCLECGNHDLQARVVDGATIRECGLCGERFGERRVVETVADRDEAEEHGFAPEVWPLVRVLRHLTGLVVEAADAGSRTRGSMPAVTLAPTGAGALHQLENLAMSLQLGAGQLLCAWMLDVECPRHLTFVLRPRSGNLREARLDLDTLRRHLERDMRLSWWKHRTAAT